MLGFIPSGGIFHNREMLYVAIGILGATVMPHNLYLHSSIVQTRNYPIGRRTAARGDPLCHRRLDLRADVRAVHQQRDPDRRGRGVPLVRQSGRRGNPGRLPLLLSPVLGVGVASTLFAVALLASGQNSTLTGTLAGQIVMEGFLNFRIRPWLRRLITRLIAIVPAVAIIGMYGESKTTELLVASQVVLSMQLGFAVWPLMRFTSERAKMGPFANGRIDSGAWLDGDAGHHYTERQAPLRHVRAGSGAERGVRAWWRSVLPLTPKSIYVSTHPGRPRPHQSRRSPGAAHHRAGTLTRAEILLVHVADGWAARNLRSAEPRGVGGDSRGPRLSRAHGHGAARAIRA